LYHWDLPQALHDDHGGWQSKDTPRAFAAYAGYIAEQLGDRVKHLFTINEFASFTEGGYQGIDSDVGGGKIVHLGGAPGLRLDNAGLNQVRHHAVLGHGLAVQAIRANGPGDLKIGFADNIRVAVPILDRPEDIRAAETLTRERNARYMTVMLEGPYLDSYLEAAGQDAPTFTDEELHVIGSPLDFVGINVYRPNAYVVASDEQPGYQVIPISGSHPTMKAKWHVLDPEVMYWAPRQVHSIWGAQSIFITENGCAAADGIPVHGYPTGAPRTTSNGPTDSATASA
jgi:beta-glucosidase